MTSLAEAYEGNAREVASLRRVYTGFGLVVLGATLAVLAILVATTELFAGVLTGEFATRRYGGILGGLAVPVALVGVFTVLPTGRRIRAAAAISATICLLGVALFAYAYPSHWDGHGQDLTLLVSAVYLLGLFTAVWCLFTAVVNFKTRNDPGGTLEMHVTRRGETKIVEVEGSRSGLGGIGFLGNTPDGEVETQTNVDAGSTGRRTSGNRSRDRRSAAASDGGSTAGIRSPLDERAPDRDGTDAEIVDGPETPSPADRYCGNCRHFEYVRTESGMTPYCRDRGETMNDMDACEEWTPNRP
ncbi:DUF7139 domain-containing protein [Natrononativus amylolyticus]|uniref:DUF7139 domain-containing protein n=1 Tax=Natrononativus amylolyticus TaxID=2963434 RepID=UPI0020CE7CDF|nr:hypothetical protein [Natrononativus amylolyticus]